MSSPHQNHKQRRREVKEFEEEVIQVDRVTRVVKGGRRLRFRATVVIGDRKGQVGLGIGKAGEVQIAIQKGVARAQKSLVQVPIYSGSIPHQVKTKFKASQVFLKPAGEGTGVIAGGPVRKIMDLAGIRNILSKSYGSSNRLNCAKATMEALRMLRERPELEKDSKKGTKEEIRETKSDVEVKKISRKEAELMASTAKKKEAPKAKTASDKPSTK